MRQSWREFLRLHAFKLYFYCAIADLCNDILLIVLRYDPIILPFFLNNFFKATFDFFFAQIFCINKSKVFDGSVVGLGVVDFEFLIWVGIVRNRLYLKFLHILVYFSRRLYFPNRHMYTRMICVYFWHWL